VQYTTINGVTTYYDPSYGTVYQGGNNAQAAQSFQANAVLGYANSVANGAAQITVKQRIANMFVFTSQGLPY